MGETREEVSQALRDLHEAGCELVTITQYLRPSAAPPPGRALGQARGVRRAAGRGRGDRLLRACSAARWCVRRTAPDGCTVRRWTPATDARADLSASAHTDHEGHVAWQERPRPSRPKPEEARAGSSSSARPTRWPRRPTRGSACGSSASSCVGAVVGFGGLLRYLLAGHSLVFSIVGGVMVGLLAALIVFGRRAQSAGVRPDRGPARRRRGRARHARAAAGRSSPAIAFNQAAGRRAPRGRPARHRAGRRGQPQPAQAAADQRAPQARAGRRRGPDPRDRGRRRRGPGAAAPSWSSTSQKLEAARSSPPR